MWTPGRSVPGMSGTFGIPPGATNTASKACRPPSASTTWLPSIAETVPAMRVTSRAASASAAASVRSSTDLPPARTAFESAVRS